PEDRVVERVLTGLPMMGAELTEKTIPSETGLIGATVSFTKGCYTGQELVARIDSRGGHVARRLHGLALSGSAPAGIELVAGDQPAGVLTSVVAAEPGGWVGLGYVRRGADASRLRAGSAGPEVALRELPAWG
ncbi:MAG: YgfZ/GcvT domain-containing protein, partial [Acidimicrobiales bacterium]